MSGSETGRDRVSTGVPGLDEMLSGGFPRGHVVLVMGPPGVGKTCLALQYLMAGDARGERTLYLSLEEDGEALKATARQFGWPLDEGIAAQRVKLVKVDPRETDRALRRIQSELPKELQEFKPGRIVVDSVSLLNMLAPDEASRRNALFDLAKACRSSGATSLFTAEADPHHPEVSRDGLSEYVADGVLILGYSEDLERHRVRLLVHILKMRRTAHVRTRQPYPIGPRGIEVDARAVDIGGP